MKTTDSTGKPLATSVTDLFFSAYKEAALWSSTYKNGDREDNPMDDGEHYLAPETEDIMLHDCAGFLNYCETENIDAFPDYDKSDIRNEEMSGHDFWLTRNRHGVGYWDRGLEDTVGRQLTDAAYIFGSADLYIGDDGLIYQY